MYNFIQNLHHVEMRQTASEIICSASLWLHLNKSTTLILNNEWLTFSPKHNALRFTCDIHRVTSSTMFNKIITAQWSKLSAIEQMKLNFEH